MKVHLQGFFSSEEAIDLIDYITDLLKKIKTPNEVDLFLEKKEL
jgi:hypothetical protein